MCYPPPVTLTLRLRYGLGRVQVGPQFVTADASQRLDL
jgi:hypothetical protein